MTLLNSQILKKEGFLHLHSLIDTDAADRAKIYLINTYKDEHSRLVASKILPEYTQDSPWPADEETVQQILSHVPQLDVLNVVTAYGSLSLQSRLHSVILSLLTNGSNLIKAVEPIFGTNQELFCHLAPAVRIIYPGNKVAYVPNHVDIGYNSHIRLRHPLQNEYETPPFVTVWIPLQGCSSTHGGLGVYPEIFVEQTEINNHSESLWIPALGQDANQFIPDYTIGDIIIFHPFLLHGSVPNLSKRSEKGFPDTAFRVSMDVRVFSGQSITTKHYMNLRTGERYGPRDGPCG
ncbi:MAG: hypothetical protein WCQ20_07005 [Synechococcaceae cyanobacterium ELA739]